MIFTAATCWKYHQQPALYSATVPIYFYPIFLLCGVLLFDCFVSAIFKMVEGPKWCGKTTTSEVLSNSLSLLLEGEVPRLIDEWQIAPKLWDAVRYEVDHRNEEGQFILTGSAVPVKSDEIQHTGIGRFAWVMMRPIP